MVHNIKINFIIASLLTFFILISFPQSVMPAGKNTAKKDTKKEETQQQEKSNPYAKAEISTRIIPSINKTFGYEIIVNGKTRVRQPNIPALPGNNGFTSKEKAQKVADFVVKKIRNNEMPPTVTIEDLNRMGILKSNVK